MFGTKKQQAKCFRPLQGVWGHATPENFENVGYQIAGNCISWFISNLIILLWLDHFNSKLTRDMSDIFSKQMQSVKSKLEIGFKG